MRIDGPQITGSFSLNGEGVQDLDVFATTSSLNTFTSSVDTTMGHVMTATHSLNTFTSSADSRMISIEGKTGSYATTGSNTFIGTQTVQGSIVPSAHATYDLGSPGNNFRHLYLSSASLYIDGTKVLGSTTQELQITTDNGQSFKILEAGSDTITLQSNDGNITLATSGGGDVILDPTSGIIALKGTTTIYAGNRVLSSDGNAIQFGNSVTMTGSLIVTGYIETQELRTTYISSSILYRSGSTKFGDELTDTHAFTGSLLVSGSISVPGSGLISGSSQVDVMSTTNIARLATTGSNTFSGNILISKTGTTSIELNSTTATSYSAFFHSENGTPKAYWEYVNSSFSDSTRRNYLEAYNAVGGFSVYTAGSKVLDISTSGNVGVGNTSPSAKLDIEANSSTWTARVINTNTTTNNAGLLVKAGVNSGNEIILAQKSNGTSVFLVDASGNVGIGTTSPGSKLQVEGGEIRSTTTNGGVALYRTGDTGEIAAYNWAGSAYLNLNLVGLFHTFTTSTTERMRITSGGNVGINSTSPQSRFEVVDGTGSVFRAINSGTNIMEIGNYKANGSGYQQLDIGASIVNFVTGTAGGGSATNRMRIISDGRIGIGTTNPSGILHVTTSGTTASAPSLGWPVYNGESDANSRSVFIDTAGNGGVGTAGQGATISLILGQYFDSRVIITTPGAGSSSPSDQGTGRGRDIMIKAGTADNTIGYTGGRLYLNGGIGYGAGGFNANGGHIIMQGLTGSGNVGINDTNPQTKLSINGANYIEMATFTCTSAAATTIVTDNSGYVQFSNGTARHLSNSSVFTSVTDGIRILKAGIVQVTVSQDITTAGTTGYVLLYIQKNKSTVSENLITNTNGEWDGINGVATIAVSADDVINFYYSASNITSLDAGSWSQYSFIWASR
jgi:hypothetical protein